MAALQASGLLTLHAPRLAAALAQAAAHSAVRLEAVHSAPQHEGSVAQHAQREGGAAGTDMASLGSGKSKGPEAAAALGALAAGLCNCLQQLLHGAPAVALHAVGVLQLLGPAGRCAVQGARGISLKPLFYVPKLLSIYTVYYFCKVICSLNLVQFVLLRNTDKAKIQKQKKDCCLSDHQVWASQGRTIKTIKSREIDTSVE